MDDNALLNAGQSSPAPAPQQAQADSSAPSGGFQRPQGVDESTGSDIANAVAQTPNPLHTVVRSMSGAILGALGHAAKLAAQYAPQVAAGLPSNTPIGGAGRQAGQEVMQERQQKQAEADKQKLMQQQQEQQGFERDIQSKRLAMDQALNVKQIADLDSAIRSRDFDMASKTEHDLEQQYDAITKVDGAHVGMFMGKPIPDFQTADEAEQWATEHPEYTAPGGQPNLLWRVGQNPRTHKFEVWEIPNSGPRPTKIKLPDGQEFSGMLTPSEEATARVQIQKAEDEKAIEENRTTQTETDSLSKQLQDSNKNLSTATSALEKANAAINVATKNLESPTFWQTVSGGKSALNDALAAAKQEKERAQAAYDGAKKQYDTDHSAYQLYQQQRHPHLFDQNQTSAGPKIGEVRTINGVPAHWDGHGWLPNTK